MRRTYGSLYACVGEVNQHKRRAITVPAAGIISAPCDVWGLNWTETPRLSQIPGASVGMSGSLGTAGTLRWLGSPASEVVSGPVPSHMASARDLSRREAVHLAWWLNTSKS